MKTGRTGKAHTACCYPISVVSFVLTNRTKVLIRTVIWLAQNKFLEARDGCVTKLLLLGWKWTSAWDFWKILLFLSLPLAEPFSLSVPPIPIMECVCNSWNCISHFQTMKEMPGYLYICWHSWTVESMAATACFWTHFLKRYLICVSLFGLLLLAVKCNSKSIY